jgi:acyl carrier protein
MNRANIDEVVLAALYSVAPEAESAPVRADVELREQMAFDSLDFLNFVEALGTRTGIEVPERDYPELLTLDSCAAYLARRWTPQ